MQLQFCTWSLVSPVKHMMEVLDNVRHCKFVKDFNKGAVACLFMCTDFQKNSTKYATMPMPVFFSSEPLRSWRLASIRQ